MTNPTDLYDAFDDTAPDAELERAPDELVDARAYGYDEPEELAR